MPRPSLEREPESYPYEDQLGRRAAKILHGINIHRSARGKRHLTAYEWDAYSTLCREYQNAENPAAKDGIMLELRRLNGDPEGISGLGIREDIRRQVGLA